MVQAGNGGVEPGRANPAMVENLLVDSTAQKRH